MMPVLGTIVEIAGRCLLQTVFFIYPVMLIDKYVDKKIFEKAARRLEDLPEVDLSDAEQLLEVLQAKLLEGRLNPKDAQLASLAFLRHLSAPHSPSNFIGEVAGDRPPALLLAPVAGRLSVPSTLLCNVALGEDGTVWWQELDEGRGEVPRHFNYARGSKEGIRRSLRGEIGRLGRDLTEYKWMLVRFALIQGLDILLTTVVRRWLLKRQWLAALRAQRGAPAADRPVEIGLVQGTGMVVPLNRRALWEDNGQLWTTDVAGKIVPYIPVPEDNLPRGVEEDGEETGVEGEELDRNIACTICWARVRRAAFLDCGHRVCCAGCARRVAKGPGRKCPMCSQPIKRVVRIYDS
ncbi:RING/U-box superfamily protein [Klebsormidium nitens]|uniref:RING/U-box superfamily protein n=1 Tax=Klebsormidium nitens TaxID=105231 RepID=A0A1Y1HL99_KLENI|nr:RING/U-box superfamily protein [Klebsormidium nitens]|eukprot:GAQ79390.1 RING/U-box superfamily protein [Klebsormidium nitens]